MEIKLNPNGWHKRLQEYVFMSNPPEFQNFCPYFWITIFCIFAAPVVMICKRLYHIGTSVSEFVDNNIVMPLVMAGLQQASKEDVFIGYCLCYRTFNYRNYRHIHTHVTVHIRDWVLVSS